MAMANDGSDYPTARDNRASATQFQRGDTGAGLWGADQIDQLISVIRENVPPDQITEYLPVLTQFFQGLKWESFIVQLQGLMAGQVNELCLTATNSGAIQTNVHGTVGGTKT